MGPTDTDERGTGVCDDGADNDNDGTSDYVEGPGGDPGCSSVTDTSERGTTDSTMTPTALSIFWIQAALETPQETTSP